MIRVRVRLNSGEIGLIPGTKRELLFLLQTGEQIEVRVGRPAGLATAPVWIRVPGSDVAEVLEEVNEAVSLLK